jgi:hypothetical protein
MAKVPRTKKNEIEDVPTEEDIKRGDEILKRMLQSKPKPQKSMVGKGNPTKQRRPPGNEPKS